MRKSYSLVALALILSIAAAADVRAQQPGTPAQERSVTPLELEIVISRFQGDKRISSLPYLLAVNAVATINGAPETQLNMGADVPVPNTAFTPAAGGAQGVPVRSYNYRSVGTSITASAARVGDDRFELRLSIDDSSVYTSSDDKQGGPIVAELPVFRNFRTRNNLTLRDGQSRQYTAATDRVSGEVVKVDVTLKVVK